MHADDLFTAPQVAKLCSTDLKTIHNWVNRGKIRFFRTPGRHLRFRRQDILEFLNKFGYPIPDSFDAEKPRVVVIDNSEDHVEGLRRIMAVDVELEAFADHMDALLSIGRQAPSLVLVNGTCDPDMIRVVERIKSAEKKLPVAVYGGDQNIKARSIKAGANQFFDTVDVPTIRRLVLSMLATP
jgi:excisionase family DNA binding protein